MFRICSQDQSECQMFHHFQYNNLKFKTFAKKKIGILPFDIRNLIQLCQEDMFFLDLVQRENRLLIEAIGQENKSDRNSKVQEYLKARKKRVMKYSKERIHLEKVEDFYVIQEGSARYLEFQCMNVFSDFRNNINSPKVSKDPSFEEFESIDLTSEDLNYLTYAGATDYHYAIGFNTIRLLDKLGVEYKKDIFNAPEIGLHKYLERHLNYNDN